MKKWLLTLMLLVTLPSFSQIIQNCKITPTNVGVQSGGQIPFQAANCGINLRWSVLGGNGDIDQTGKFTAWASIFVQNQNRGCQEGPNNSPWNIPVRNLPTDPNWADWQKRIAQDGPQYLQLYHGFKLYPQLLSFYPNIVDDNTTKQLMKFFYGQPSDYYPVPDERYGLQESGWSIHAYAGYDRHRFTINKNNCEETEIYNSYVDFKAPVFGSAPQTTVQWNSNNVQPIPQGYGVFVSGATGKWTPLNGGPYILTVTAQNVGGINTGTLPIDSSQWGLAPAGIKISSTQNGCADCNSASGAKFSPTSYAAPYGTDAAAAPISQATLKMQEIWDAVKKHRRNVGHSFRTTLSNRYIGSWFEYPAGGNAYPRGVWVLTAATNATQATFTSAQDMTQYSGLPCDNYTWTPGCSFKVIVRGYNSGPWKAANGVWPAVAGSDKYHFTIPTLNTSSFGAMPPGGSFDLFLLPYGATFVLTWTDAQIEGFCTTQDWCPEAKVALYTMVDFGLVLVDGTDPSDNFDSGWMSSEFHPHEIIDALTAIRQSTLLQPFERYLRKVVDRSSQQLNTNKNMWLQTATNRTQVCVTGSLGSACTDVLPQGTTIGVFKERLTLAAGWSGVIPAWVNGNVNHSLAYTLDGGIPGANVNLTTGFLTIPNCQAKQRGMLIIASAADPQATPKYVELTCLPKGSDNSFRFALGNYSGDYKDSTNQIWYGSWGSQQFDNSYEVPGLWFGGQLGSWQGLAQCANDTWTGTDSQIYSRSISLSQDPRFDFTVPNGWYRVTIYAEPGFGGFGPNNTCGTTAGKNIYDLRLRGQLVRSQVDGYVQAGNKSYAGYSFTFLIQVTDNTIDFVARMKALSTYGVSISAVKVTPVSSNPLMRMYESMKTMFSSNN